MTAPGASILLVGALLQTPAALPRLTIDGTRILTADGRPFEWRGVTAFRLIDHLADGRDRDAIAYLDWARGTGFTLVRVLTRIDGWAELGAEEGRAHLPALLKHAGDRGLYVQVVATVGSGSTPYDFRAHARGVAEACSRVANCLFEFANEPGHPSQATALHDMAAVDRFAAEATANLPSLLWTAGAAWSGDADPKPGGRFLVRHLERSGSPIDQIERLGALADLARRVGKPVVSNEPLGADEAPGEKTGRQRSNDPAVFFRMGTLCRTNNLPCTFHLQDGLATVVPGPVQQAAARAFIRGVRGDARTADAFVLQSQGTSAGR